MSALQRFEFEGQPLPVFTFHERPCMIVGDVGRALGYESGGKGLTDTMRSKWGDELVKGTDFDTLEGEALAAFKGAMVDSDQKSLSKTNRSLTILYESGLHLVCLKTEKPLGKKLRRFLADEVMPRLMRREAIGAALPAPMPTEAPAWFREQMAKIMTRLTALEAQRGDRFPSGLIGNREAAVYIRGPLLSLARQLASVRGASVQSVLMSLEREVRRACDHPKEEKGRTWGRLPAGKFDQAVLTISLLQVKAQEELKDYARRVAREASQLPLKAS